MYLYNTEHAAAITDTESAVTGARTKASTEAVAAVTAAVTAAETILESAPVTNMIEQFRRRAESTHLKSLSRFTGGMADVNAVQSSAFLMGMALLESEHGERVEEFIARLSMQIYESVVPAYLQLEATFSTDHLATFRDRANTHLRAQTVLDLQVRSGRDNFMRQAVNDLSGMLVRLGESKRTLAATSGEAGRLKFVALSERDKQDVLYDVEEWLWELKLFQYGANVLSAQVTGGQVLPERPSQMSTTLGGAMTGAAIGTGQAGPGIGTAVGAIVGGIGGYFEGDY